MNETYQFKDKQLIICDPDLEINIEESFAPLIIPKDHASTKGLVVKKDDSGRILRAYFEVEGKLEGQYQLYYPGGNVESECYYFEGKLHGPSRFFSENGDCISETWFYQDKKEGNRRDAIFRGNYVALNVLEMECVMGNKNTTMKRGL